MLRRFGRTSLSVLLSALVVAWGFVPPAIEHAHSGGEDMHRHEAAHWQDAAQHHEERDHHHGDHVDFADHAHATHDLPAANGSPALTAAEIVHLHVDFWGFRLVLPAPDRPSDDGKPVHAIIAALHATDSSLPVLKPTRVTGVPLASPDCHGHAAVVPTRDVGWSPPVEVPRLCDRARHERSGVLLA